MKHLFATVVILIIATSAFAQDAIFSNKLIERYEHGRNQLKSTTSVPKDKFWLTPLLLEAKQNWDILNDQAKNIFSKFYQRPEYVGTEEVATYANFAFHYSIDGPDEESVDPADLDNSGLPDYVEQMAFIFGDSLYSLYHKTTLLALPPNDNDQINDAYYDIYINGIEAGSGTYGYVSPETLIGDNPNSSNLEEADSYTSYMVVRNNYSGFGESEELCVSVTAAHEYMHAIQMGYNVDMDSWFKEAVATWAEEFAFPGYDDNFQYLSNVFLTTDIALNYEDWEDQESAEYEGHWYGAWLFVQYLTEHTSKGIIKTIYEACISKSSIHSIDQVLKDEFESDFSTIFLQYVVANSLLKVEHEFAPFDYKRAFDYYYYMMTEDGLLRFEGELKYTGEDIFFNSRTDGNDRLMRLSYENYYLTSDANFKLIFTPNKPSYEVDILLIKCSLTNGTAIQLPTYSENSSSIEITDNDQWDFYIPVVVRFDIDVDNIDPIDYELAIKNANTTNLFVNKYSNNIYPNPATDKIYIEIAEMTSGLINVELFDLAGEKVLVSQTKNNSAIDVSNLINGIYVLKISNEQGVISISKQIVK